VKGRTKFEMNKTSDTLCLGGLGEFCSVLASSDTIDILRLAVFPEINAHMYSFSQMETNTNDGLQHN
jgi:hypothetical protein